MRRITVIAAAFLLGIGITACGFRNMVNENFTEEQAREYLKQSLPKLDYWKRYEELGDDGQFEEFKQKLFLFYRII